MSLDGVLANANLVTFLNSLHGKQVLVETKSGQHFVGVFGASSPELEIGLTYAWERTAANKDNILPKKCEIKEKMVFKFADVVTVSGIWTEEKSIKGFATDRDYHSKNGRLDVDDEELEVWQGEDEGEEIESNYQSHHMPDQRQSYQKNGGWGVNEMFDANARLHGVQSTYEEDMSQYTTVDFESTEEGRARADQIARKIEQDSRSNYYARLENDDDERDLDKITTEEDLDPGRGKRGNKSSYGNSNNGRNRGGSGGQGGNKRAEGLRSDRRGSGQQQQQTRYSQVTYTARGGGSYSAAGKRNSTGDEFGGEWQNPPKEAQQRSKDGPKVFENTNYKGRTEKIGKGDKGSSGRVDGLKQWNDQFNLGNVNKQNKNEDVKEQSPAESRPQQSSSGNAWNNGPPSSLLNSNAQNATSSQESQGPPEEAVKEVTDNMIQLNVGEKKEVEIQDDEKEKIETKKFSFNPDAPVFTPRQQQPPTTPTQMQPMQMGLMPGVPIQGPLPPGVAMVPGQTMIGPWPQQGYVQMPSAPYPVYVQPQPMMSNVPMQGRGNGGVPAGNYANQPNQRRNGPGQQTMLVSNGQWANQMVVQPMGYYQYQPGAQQTAQQFPNNPQMVPQGQQAIPGQVYQQRYQMSYVQMPQGQNQQQASRYQPPPQGTHPDQNGSFQSVPPSSAASTTGPNSQPPTPGPQPPTVASPAQQPTRGSPPPAPIPPQQFQQPPTHHIPPQPTQPNYYPTPQSMYMYNQQGQMIVYGGMAPMAPVHPAEGQPHTAHMAEMPPHQQQYHDQYGQFVPAGPTYYQQQQPMSRQNSVPQNAYNGQPAPVTNATPSHPSSTAPPQTAPPAAAPQQN